MHNFWHPADTQSLWIVELINELRIFSHKWDIPMWHKYNRNQHSWASPLSFSSFSSFHNFILKSCPRAETLSIFPPHDNCKINNQYFQKIHKNEVYKREKKKKKHQSEKRNLKKKSSALLELMVKYVSYQFLFPPKPRLSFCHHDYLRTTDCWLTDGPDTAGTPAL